MKQPKNTVITGAKALFLQDMISFNPQVWDVIFQSGSNINYYKRNFKNINPSTQINNIRMIGTETKNEYTIYSKERLLVDIDKFEMDAILKKEAINNLYKQCDPNKVQKIIKIYDKNKRIIPSPESVKFLRQKNITFLNQKVNIDNLELYLREYVANRLFEENILCFIKGGSVVEILTSLKRGTKDTDTYANIDQHNQIIKALSKEKDSLFFKIKDFNKKDFSNIEQKKHARLTLIPYSINRFLSTKISKIKLTVDLDYRFDSNQLLLIKKEFNIKPHALWKLKRYYLPITHNMMIGDKILSTLHSQNKPIWRAKDMMDIFNLLSISFDVNQIQKWIKQKINSQNKYSLKDYQLFLSQLEKTKESKQVLLKNTLKTYNSKKFIWDKTIELIKKCLAF